MIILLREPVASNQLPENVDDGNTEILRKQIVLILMLEECFCDEVDFIVDSRL